MGQLLALLSLFTILLFYVLLNFSPRKVPLVRSTEWLFYYCHNFLHFHFLKYHLSSSFTEKLLSLPVCCQNFTHFHFLIFNLIHFHFFNISPTSFSPLWTLFSIAAITFNTLTFYILLFHPLSLFTYYQFIHFPFF